MYELFQYVLENYDDGTKIVNSQTKLYDVLCNKIPAKLRSILKRKDFIVKGSMGQGNKNTYPWVSIMNSNVTNTTQKGLYIVYLFKKDMSGFYISLNQGITNFENLFKTKRYEYAMSVANYFKSQIEGVSSFSSNEISLGGIRGDLGYGYERTNVLSKYYSSNNYNDSLMVADLTELVNIYDLIIKHMETRSYDQIIKDVLSEESDGKMSAEEAIMEISNAVDPDNEMPFSFNRNIVEVKPKIDRTNKFTRLTNPKLNKIDYIKKAAKDAKNGLVGEKLVLSHEIQKLYDLGLDELVEKVKWASKESDSYGYDIESFDVDSSGNITPIKIEVKTTSSKVDTEFFVSKNEVETSNKYKAKYCVYRVYDVNSQNPKFYKAYGKIEDNFILDPITFTARYKYPELV